MRQHGLKTSAYIKCILCTRFNFSKDFIKKSLFFCTQESSEVNNACRYKLFNSYIDNKMYRIFSKLKTFDQFVWIWNFLSNVTKCKQMDNMNLKVVSTQNAESHSILYPILVKVVWFAQDICCSTWQTKINR